MKNCPFCNEEVYEQAVVCIHCGKSLNIPSEKKKTENKKPPKGMHLLKFSFVLSFVLAVVILVTGLNFYNSYYYPDDLAVFAFIALAFLVVTESIQLILSLLHKISIKVCTVINFILIVLSSIAVSYLLSMYM